MGRRHEGLGLPVLRGNYPRASPHARFLPALWARRLREGWRGSSISLLSKLRVQRGSHAGNGDAARSPLATGNRCYMSTQGPGRNSPRGTDRKHQSDRALAQPPPECSTRHHAGPHPAHCQRAGHSGRGRCLGRGAREAEVSPVGQAWRAVHILHLVHLVSPPSLAGRAAIDGGAGIGLLPIALRLTASVPRPRSTVTKARLADRRRAVSQTPLLGDASMGAKDLIAATLPGWPRFFRLGPALGFPPSKVVSSSKMHATPHAMSPRFLPLERIVA